MATEPKGQQLKNSLSANNDKGQVAADTARQPTRKPKVQPDRNKQDASSPPASAFLNLFHHCVFFLRLEGGSPIYQRHPTLVALFLNVSCANVRAGLEPAICTFHSTDHSGIRTRDQ